MAQVFLSYDRADAAKARSIAQALERDGHFVWWDHHIKGGAEYGKVIEEALAAADAVVVLWSEQSIDSAWVRDEATAGRDRGRLVPVQLDDVSPPLGFRQYQNIDLRAWTGRRRPPLQGVLAAIEDVSKDQMGRPRQQGLPAPTLQTPRRPAWIFLTAISVVIAVAAALALLLWQPWRTRHAAPLVAVVPAERSETAESLASDLLIKLGVLQSSHADALQLVDVDSRQTPDFIIKVGSGNAGKGAAANLMLVDNRTDTLLWSREFTDPRGNQADLRQQMAYSAAQVMDCAVQGLGSEEQSIKLPTLKLYLSGCADLSNLLAEDPGAAAALFVKVTEQAPKFEGGWKKLILADIQAFRFSGRRDQALRKTLAGRIDQARRLNPSMAETFLAEAWLRPPSQFAQWTSLVDQAVEKDPDNPEILSFRSTALANVGLMRQSLADTRRAVKSNPLSPAARNALIIALLNGGEVEAAKTELAKAERLWPSATTVLQSRFAFEFREGDPALALQMMKAGDLGAAYTSADPAHEAFLRARINPSATNREQAIQSAGTLYRRDPTTAWVYARALSAFGNHEELISFLRSSDVSVPVATTWVLFRPDFAHLHRDSRFMLIAHRLGLTAYWRETGKWPDFCLDPDLPYDCRAEAARLA